MVQYRRSRTPGATWFFTVNLRNRSSRHLITHIEDLRKAFENTRQRRPFKTLAIVILPDHLHMVMELPSGDSDYPGRWRSIKSHFTRSLVKNGLPLIKNPRGEYNLWQRRYWEHEIRNELDLQRHVNYIHSIVMFGPEYWMKIGVAGFWWMIKGMANNPGLRFTSSRLLC